MVYSVEGFEPTTLKTSAFCLNHQTKHLILKIIIDTDAAVLLVDALVVEDIDQLEFSVIVDVILLFAVVEVEEVIVSWFATNKICIL